MQASILCTMVPAHRGIRDFIGCCCIPNREILIPKAGGIGDMGELGCASQV